MEDDRRNLAELRASRTRLDRLGAHSGSAPPSFLRTSSPTPKLHSFSQAMPSLSRSNPLLWPIAVL